jgi:hypothetical protein
MVKVGVKVQNKFRSRFSWSHTISSAPRPLILWTSAGAECNYWSILHCSKESSFLCRTMSFHHLHLDCFLHSRKVAGRQCPADEWCDSDLFKVKSGLLIQLVWNLGCCSHCSGSLNAAVNLLSKPFMRADTNGLQTVAVASFDMSFLWG